MIQNKNIIIVGTGHLAHRLKIKLINDNHKIIHSTHDDIVNTSQSVSLIKNVESFIERLENKTIDMVYLLDEKDEVNLKLIIAFFSLLPNTLITASLFNENIIPHLHSQDKNICILNPAKIAAPHFVAALYKPLQRISIANIVQKKAINVGKKKLSLIQKLAFGFLLLIITAIVFFHYNENLTWIDSLYFVVVTIATVGYGDINLANASSVSKLFDVLLILASTIFIWMIFSLTVDKILKNQLSLALGRKKYKYKNHVVLCGLGRLGYFIAEELLLKKEKVIIVEQDENGRYLNYFRQLGADVYIGDGRLNKVLDDVNVADAKALISVINNDSLNIEIGLIARSFNADLRVILRVFDEQIAEKIKDLLNIHIALSASDIADEIFYEQLKF